MSRTNIPKGHEGERNWNRNYNRLPLDPEPWRPVQFITATYPNNEGISTDGEAGEFDCMNAGEAFDHLFWLYDNNFVIYSMQGARALSDATLGKMWTVHYWNERISKMVFAQLIDVYPFKSISQDINSVWPFFEWIRSIGVTAGPLSKISEKLWRITLPRPVHLHDEGLQSHNTLYGGRREALPGRYKSMRYHDLSSAFPTAMSTMLIPQSMQEMKYPHFMEYGYALATIRIPPGMQWNPIPCRLNSLTTVYGHGEQLGWWTFEDLKHVKEVGGEVFLHRAFQGAAPRQVFQEWYDYIVIPARLSLTGDALTAAKSVFNRLWSAFTISGKSIQRRFIDGERRSIVLKTTPYRRMQNQAFVSAQIQATVRSRVLEALQKAEDPVYVDTDGIVSADRESLGIGWTIKRRMDICDIHSCGNFKWECALCDIGHPRTHYNLSVPVSDRKYAEHLLKQEGTPVNPMFGITVEPDDLETLGRQYGYEPPEILAPEHIPWDTLGEGSQQRLTV